MSPTGTFKGTPLNVLTGGCALALIRCGSFFWYNNLTGVPDTKISPQGRGKIQ